MLFFMFIGAIGGVLGIYYFETKFSGDVSSGQFFFVMSVIIVELYIAVFLQIIIHEVGHLVAGLISGYKFSSFRIGNLMWIKEDKKIKFRRMSLLGTGGQCLMSPPDMKNGQIPFVFYNMGGSLMNFITLPVSIWVFFFCKELLYLELFFLIMGIVGLVISLMNGIPLQFGTVNNDGYNVKEMSKSSESLRSFWVQMKIMEETSKGIRLKDMPKEWFSLPDEIEMKNSMVATLAVCYANRLMDAQKFEEAITVIDSLLSMDSAIVGLHRRLLICDRIFCELIGDRNSQVIEKLYDKEQVKFMKQMAKFPTVIRTEYVYELIFKGDVKKAEQIKDKFEKCAKTYPYSTDMESERELIQIASHKLISS